MRPSMVALLASTWVVLATSASAVSTPHATPRHRVARTVLALWDSKHDVTPRATVVHEVAEMPLNHLGLIVRYHDIRSGLPPVESLTDVRGVLTWFADDAMPDPRGYLRWVEALARGGTPFVNMGSLGVFRDEHGTPTPFDEINRVLATLGWRYDGGWNTTTYGVRYVVQDTRLMGFERPLPVVAPPYAKVTATASDARVLLRAAVDGRPSTVSDLMIISPRGAYVAPGYGYFVERVNKQEFRQWYVNPFEFFREVFGTNDLPKPDTATLSGRRIYYSHIDGDGWRNLTLVEPYRTRYVTAARVVLEEIIRKFPDLPVTVGVVVGDIDPAWHGSDESLAVAREIYGLPQVAPSIHTYSHPFEWGFFKTGGRDKASPARTADVLTGPDIANQALNGDPRAYDNRPFNLTTEIDEAAAFVNQLLPRGKRVDLVQWTGDTRPFEQAATRARLGGLANINGGDTRFDREFPSAAWVAPLGLRLGRELQVYASNSNENTYTDLWRDRFFGYSFLTKTVQNTGSPRRLKPYNLYYHMYSGERLSSLNAVLANLAYARSLPLAPIEAARFSRIVDGFFTVTFEPLGNRAWRVRDRGALQTIRFDQATFDAVDFSRSHGVIGERHELGSLFVALDEMEKTPIVALKRIQSGSREPRESVPYLVESRWRVFQVRRESGVVQFVTQGYGPGDSTWSWPFGDNAIVSWKSASGQSGELHVARDPLGLLALRLPRLTGELVEVAIRGAGAARDAR